MLSSSTKLFIVVALVLATCNHVTARHGRKRAVGRGKACTEGRTTCKRRLKCKNGFCARTVAAGRKCDNKGRICPDELACSGSKYIKRCVPFPPLGRSYSCLEDRFRFTFSSATQAVLRSPGVEGVYEFTYIADDRQAVGVFGYPTAPGGLDCSPGGPLNSDEYGEEDLIFSPDFTQIVGVARLCTDPDVSLPFTCIEMTG